MHPASSCCRLLKLWTDLISLAIVKAKQTLSHDNSLPTPLKVLPVLRHALRMFYEDTDASCKPLGMQAKTDEHEMHGNILSQLGLSMVVVGKHFTSLLIAVQWVKSNHLAAIFFQLLLPFNQVKSYGPEAQ